jgi:hypothetical protein
VRPAAAGDFDSPAAAGHVFQVPGTVGPVVESDHAVADIEE